MKTNPRRHIPGLLALALLACGAAHAQEDNKVRVTNEGGIRDEWTLADGVKLSAPGYPGSFAPRGDNVCVAMGYRINPDGTTGEYTMLKGWSSSGGDKEPEEGFWAAYSQAAAGALSQWRFKPRPEVGTPRAVDTVATMTFMGKQPQDAADLRSRCQVADIIALLEQARRERADRSDINRHQIDRAYRQQTRSEMIRTPRQ